MLLARLIGVKLRSAAGQCWLISISEATEQRGAEAGPQEREGRYRALVESIPGVIYSAALGATRTMVFVSPQIQRLTGHRPADYAADPDLWGKSVHPADRERVLAAVARAQASGEPFESEYRLITCDGRVVWCQDEGVVIRSADADGACLQGVMRDVTKRKSVEAALRESAERFSTVFRASPQAIAVVRLSDDALVDANPAWRELTGLTLAESHGRTSNQTAPWVDRKTRDRLIETLHATGTACGVETQFRRRSGKVADALLSAERIDVAGEACALVVAQDVTELKRAEGARRRSQALLARAERIGNMGSWEWDLETDALVWSDQTYRIFGRERRRFVPTYSAALAQVHAEDRPLVERAIQDALAKRAGYDMACRVVPEGRPARWVHARGELTFHPDGRPKSMIGIIVDITERKALEAQLRQAQRLDAIGQFASGIAHDLSNWAAALAGHVDVARRMWGSQQPADDALRGIEQIAGQVAGITGALLTFCRHAPLAKEPLELSVLVTQTCGLLRRMLPRSIELQTDVPQRPVWIHGNRVQFQQVILNLALNARDAMPDGGTLSFLLAPVRMPRSQAGVRGRVPAAVRLEVRDTGIGMSASDRARVFEPFFTTKPPGHGAGLGLAIVHGIIQDHDGTVEIQSEPGRGTTFAITLPALALELADAQPGCVGRGELILLGDGDEYVRALVAAELERHGYVVVAVADGDSVLRSYVERKGTLRLLLLDADLPRRSGVDCLRQIRRGKDDMPTIIMSGSTDLELTTEFHARLIRKPFQMPELLHTIYSALGGVCAPEG